MIKRSLIMLLCLSLAGCMTPSVRVPKAYVEPQYGMTQKALVDLLGLPVSIEVYKKTDLTRIEFYIYTRNDSPSQEKIPICLVNKKVIGWGKAYYEDHVTEDEVRIK